MIVSQCGFLPRHCVSESPATVRVLWQQCGISPPADTIWQTCARGDGKWWKCVHELDFQLSFPTVRSSRLSCSSQTSKKKQQTWAASKRTCGPFGFPSRINNICKNDCMSLSYVVLIYIYMYVRVYIYIYICILPYIYILLNIYIYYYICTLLYIYIVYTYIYYYVVYNIYIWIIVYHIHPMPYFYTLVDPKKNPWLVDRVYLFVVLSSWAICAAIRTSMGCVAPL